MLAACITVSLLLSMIYRFYTLTIIVTAIQLAQGAATILLDDTDKLTGGVYTPACLGQPFIDRLQDAGVQFKIEIRNT